MSKNIDLIAQKKRIAKLAKAKGIGPDVVKVLNRLSTWIEPVYGYELEACPYGTRERTGSFVYGSPWTDDEHGYPEYPLGTTLCQLDLDEIRQVTGKDVGNGLLQFFMDIDITEYEDTRGWGSANYRNIPRSVVEAAGAPNALPTAGKTPFEFFERKLYSIDSFSPESEEYQVLLKVDPQRAEKLAFEWDVQVSMALARIGILANSKEYWPAHRIVNWVDCSTEYYSELVDMSDQDILEYAEDDQCFDQMKMNFAGDHFLKGLFVWPDVWPEHWPADAKPFFTMYGWDEGTFINEWSILYREKQGGVSNGDRFEFFTFGNRELSR